MVKLMKTYSKDDDSNGPRVDEDKEITPVCIQLGKEKQNTWKVLFLIVVTMWILD